MIKTDSQHIGYRHRLPAEHRPMRTREALWSEVTDMNGNGNGMRRQRRVLRHLTSLLRVALYLAPSRQDAENLVQDVVVDACRKGDNRGDPAGDKYALFSDLTNRFLHRYNVPIGRRPEVSSYREQDHAFQDIIMEPANAKALGRIMDEVSPTEMENTIRDLPTDCRLLIVMSFIEGFSSGEIAGMIGVESDLIRSNLAYCREALLRKLLNDGIETMRVDRVAHRS
jgi:RNA polymerase sigma factor (sigma-70 family)